MTLPNDDFPEFAREFDHLAWPDEFYRVPIEVESQDGAATWYVFLRHEDEHRAAEWVKSRASAIQALR